MRLFVAELRMFNSIRITRCCCWPEVCEARTRKCGQEMKSWGLLRCPVHISEVVHVDPRRVCVDYGDVGAFPVLALEESGIQRNALLQRLVEDGQQGAEFEIFHDHLHRPERLVNLFLLRTIGCRDDGLSSALMHVCLEVPRESFHSHIWRDPICPSISRFIDIDV